MLSDVPPPASRCYANCGPLLIRPSVASAAVVRVLAAGAANASMAPFVPATLVGPPVVPSAVPLALKEEVTKAVSATQKHATACGRRTQFPSCRTH